MNRKVEVEVHGPIAHIILSRPEKLNALDMEALELLGAAVKAVNEDANVRVVILRGLGRSFCAGGELEGVKAFNKNLNKYLGFLTTWHAVFNAIEASPKPMVAAVHGFALGGGFDLMLACDIVVLGEETKLSCNHSRHGFFPASGGTQRLVRQMGPRLARWLLLSGENLTPKAALDGGIVNDVVGEERVLDRAIEMAQILAERSPFIMANIKKALKLGDGLSLDVALQAERPIALASMLSEDTTIGIEAIERKQPPVFVGR